MNLVLGPSSPAPRSNVAPLPVPPNRTATTSFGQVPALTVTVSPQSIAPRLPRRPITTSRHGYDHSWIGLLLLAALFLVAAAPRAQAEAALDHWTKITVPDTIIKTPTDMIYVGGKYWATGSSGRVQYSSDGGATWNVVQTPSTQYLVSIAYAQGRFVVVGDNSTILSSPNGASWTLHQEIAGGDDYRQVIFGGGKFVIVGSKLTNSTWHTDVRVSTNGTDWIPVDVNAVNAGFGANGITWGNNQFVMVGDGPTIFTGGAYNVMTSPDGVMWTKQKYPSYTDPDVVGYINGVYVAAGYDYRATSTDGVTWTKLTHAFNYTYLTFYGAKTVNGRLFLFGQGGTVASSANGLDWENHVTNTSLDIVALDYNDDRLLIFRQGIISSGNGPAKSDYWPPVVVSGGDTGDTDPVDPNAKANIANISTRAWVGTNDTKLITGFVVQGSNPKTVLVRAVGPTLASYGVGGTLVDPQVTVLNAEGTAVASNNDWGTFADQAALAAETAAVFAFPLADGSKDAAMLVTLAPGSYTIHTSGADGGAGVALAEVYDCDSGAPCKLVNISSRGFIGTGDSVGIPGFVVAGNKPKKLLVRGVGPTLNNWGVPATLSDPKITLYAADQSVVAENDNWGQFANQAELTAATAQVFAFALNAGSNDAALIVTVNPGLYTAVVSGNNTTTGVALVEVYEIE